MTKTEALIEAAWARALFEALVRYEETPLYEATVREHGRPTLLTAAAQGWEPGAVG